MNYIANFLQLKGNF